EITGTDIGLARSSHTAGGKGRGALPRCVPHPYLQGDSKMTGCSYVDSIWGPATLCSLASRIERRHLKMQILFVGQRRRSCRTNPTTLAGLRFLDQRRVPALLPLAIAT